MSDVDLRNVLGAVRAALQGNRLFGTSADTKPTALPDGSALPDGAEFLERDTGDLYRWDADAHALSWSKVDSLERTESVIEQRLFDIASTLGLIHKEIRKLRMAAELMTNRNLSDPGD